MKAILIPVKGKAKIIEISGDTVGEQLKSLQEAVGGHITTVTISSDACLICDDEGVLKGKPLNAQASMLGAPIVGDVLIVGVGEDDFTDVPEPMIEMMKERFKIL